MSNIAKQLDIKAGMIEMGEQIAFGSDTALMREASCALVIHEDNESKLREESGTWRRTAERLEIEKLTALKDLAEQIFDTTENMNRCPYPDEDLLLETLCRVRDICRQVLGAEAP